MGPCGKIHRELEQGSPEWLAIRMGKVTASRLADMLAQTKSGWGASRANYMAELVAERLTGKSPDRFQSGAMAYGSATEDAARQHYAFKHAAIIEQVAFVEHPHIEYAGCSPDGFVGDDGGVETKCPNIATHIATLKGKSLPGNYYKQIMWNMACTGREWWDYVSFCPDLPPEMRSFEQRVYRNEAVIREFEAEVRSFLAEVEAEIQTLKRLYPGAS